MTDYIKIDWSAVKAGDVLMHDNGDRLTVKRVKKSGTEKGYIPIRWIETVTAFQTGEGWKSDGFSPYRKTAPVPTEPGAYMDKYGNALVLDGDDGLWIAGGLATWLPAAEISHRAPFTRLVPMPAEEQVQNAVWDSTEETFTNDKVNRIVTAVMALLEQEDAG